MCRLSFYTWRFALMNLSNFPQFCSGSGNTGGLITSQGIYSA
jgi:hypothetical protein